MGFLGSDEVGSFENLIEKKKKILYIYHIYMFYYYYYYKDKDGELTVF